MNQQATEVLKPTVGKKAATRWALTSLKVTISVVLLTWIVSRANLADVFEAIAEANPLWLGIAACLPAVGYSISSVRWHGLLRVQGVAVPLRTLFQSNLVAGFARHFLPSTIGGDAVRGYDSWRAGASKSVAATTLVIDRLLGLIALVSFAVISIAVPSQLTTQHPTLRLAVMIVAGALLAIAWVVFVPTPRLIAGLRRIAGKLPKALESVLIKILMGITAYQGKTSRLIRAFALSVLLQANVVTFYFAIGQAMDLQIPYHFYFFIVPIAAIVMMVPVSINAIGIREGIFVYLLGSFAVGNSQAIAFAWIELGLFLLYGVIGGIVYAVRRPPERRNAKSESRNPKQSPIGDISKLPSGPVPNELGHSNL